MMFPTFAFTMSLVNWTFQKQEYSSGIAACLAQPDGNLQRHPCLETSANWIILEESQEHFVAVMN